MFNNADFEDLSDYALALLGPVLNAYFASLIERCRQGGVPFVGFVSREGVFLHEAFQAFCRARGLVQPSGNMVASRALLFKLLIDDGALDLVTRQEFSGPFRRLLADRFSIIGEIEADDLKHWGDMHFDLPRDADRLIASWRLLGDALAPRLAEKKDAYRAYLDRVGFVPGSIVADVGYAGSLQSLLGWILERPIDGYYLMTTTDQKRFHEAYTGSLSGFFDKVGRFGEGVAMLDHSLLFEVIMSSDTGQAEDIDDCDGMLPWRFRYGPQGKSQYGHAIIAFAQAAVIDYLVANAAVPSASLTAPDHVGLLFDYFRRMASLPAMAPRLLVQVGDVDDRISGLGFINPWQYLSAFQ